MGKFSKILIKILVEKQPINQLRNKKGIRCWYFSLFFKTLKLTITPKSNPIIILKKHKTLNFS